MFPYGVATGPTAVGRRSDTVGDTSDTVADTPDSVGDTSDSSKLSEMEFAGVGRCRSDGGRRLGRDSPRCGGSHRPGHTNNSPVMPWLVR